MYLDESDFRPFQQRIVDFVLDHDEGCALWVDMGLGKTVSTLTALQRLRDRFDMGRTLVVAPLRVARKVWSDEIAKWAHLDLTVSVAVGTASERHAALAREADVYCLNRENIPWLTDQYRKKGGHFLKSKPWPYDTLVIDESTGGFRNQGTWWKCIDRVRPQIERVIELTGEPAPRGLIDLWPQIYLIDQGKRLGTTQGAFEQRWFRPPWPGEWGPQPEPHARKQIAKRVNDLVICLRAEDYLDLPPIVYNDIRLQLSEKEYTEYHQLKKKRIIQMDGGVVTAMNAGVLAGKLAQLSSGGVYDSKDRKVVHEFHTHKNKVLLEVLNEAAGKPVLVFYWYKPELQRILDGLRKARIGGVRVLTSAKDEDDWNAGRVRVMLAQAASVSHGLNLQHGGETIFWYTVTPNQEIFNQANARLFGGYRRIGKTPVVHLAIAEGTFDERALEILTGRRQEQNALLRAVIEETK